MKKVTFDFPEDFHRKLKIVAAEQGLTMRDIVIKCVQDCIKAPEEK